MLHQFGNHSWAMGWSWVIGFILLILIAWFIVRTFNQGKVNQLERKSPLDILKERYARGEIDKEEFEQRKKDLI